MEPLRWSTCMVLKFLAFTGYVRDNGKPFGLLGMFRETQPWELMGTRILGCIFRVGDEKIKHYYLRWARFYFSMCLSLGFAIMFTTIEYDLLLPGFNKSCIKHLKEPEPDRDPFFQYVPIDKFYGMYATMLILCKAADTGVGWLTKAVTKWGGCSSQLVRLLLYSFGAAFIGGALLFEFSLDLDINDTTKILAYMKVVGIERAMNWLGLTPAICITGYLTGRCLYKPELYKKEDDAWAGTSLVGTSPQHAASGGGPVMSSGTRPMSMTHV